MAYTLHTLHLPFCFILGGSLCEELELFNSFKISPRSSKSEFVCKSYARFSFGFLLFFFWTDVRCISDVRHIGRPKSTKIIVSRWSVSMQIYQKSDVLRTSDTSDVRTLSDVRHATGIFFCVAC